MKKTLALVLALVMCFSLLAACGSKDDAQNTGSTANTGNAGTPGTQVIQSGDAGTVGTADATVKYKDTVKISQVSEITNGAFYSVTTTQSAYCSVLTHQGMFKFNYDTGTADPVIAKSAEEIGGDGKKWKVTLNEGVMFHKGDKEYAELKASDVKYTYEYCAPNGKGVEEGVVVRTLTTMNYVDKIEVTGDYELTFTLNTPLFDFPVYLDGKIICEAAMKEFGTTDGQDVGTGPYYINYDKSAQGQQWVFTRYDDYWAGIDNCPTKNIVFVIQGDLNTAAASLEAGEIDMVKGLGSTLSLGFQGNDDYTILSTPATTQAFTGFNTYDGLGFFDGEDTEKQIKLRQAIRLAIDKTALHAVIYATNPASGAILHSIWHSGTDSFVPYETEFNVEKAQAMMKELGYNENNRLPLKLAHYSSYGTYAQIIQDQLKAIYIDVECVVFDTSIFGSTLRTGQGWDLVVNYYGTATTIGGTMGTVLQSNGSGAKTYGWNSAEMDKRIAEVLNQTSADAQRAAFKEFQTWANDYVPGKIPTHTGTTIDVMTSDVEGYKVCPNSGSQDYSTIRVPE